MSVYDNDGRVNYLGGDTYDVELPGTPGLPGSQDGRVQPSPNSLMFEAFVMTENPIKVDVDQRRRVPGPEGELMAVRRYTTMRDVIEREIIPALGEHVDDYDVETIAREAFAYRVDTNEQGDELLNTAGFEQVVDVEEFWRIAAKYDRSDSQREDD